MPWEAVEMMHWQMGEREMALQVGIVPIHHQSSQHRPTDEHEMAHRAGEAPFPQQSSQHQPMMEYEMTRQQSSQYQSMAGSEQSTYYGFSLLGDLPRDPEDCLWHPISWIDSGDHATSLHGGSCYAVGTSH